MSPYLLMLGGAFAFAVMGAFTHAAAEYYDWQVIALAWESPRRLDNFC